MIELSVGLPMFKSNKIAWLALESLCRQEEVKFEWELIVCEELYYENRNEYLGHDFLDEYEDRLEDVGCRDIKLIGGDDHIPLERKWKAIHAQMAPESQLLLLQGSDDYSAANRLARTKYIFERKACDWYSDCAYFYHIRLKKMLFYRPEKLGVFIAIRKELLAGLPDRDRNCSVDSFLHDHCLAMKPDLVEYLDCGTGVCTDGFNRISQHRSHLYSHIEKDFSMCDPFLLTYYLPQMAVSRLNAMAERK
jgi:hypothetical protein